MNTINNADSLSEMVERRNSKLKILFSKLGNNFRIVGNINNPAVIINEDTVLSVWVHNFFCEFP